MTEITTTQRRALRAAAHGLKPVVSISQKGLTDAVLKEIDRSLKAHELIKIRVYEAERDQRNELLSAVCEALDAAPVQHIGNLLIIWRERPADPDVAGSRKPAKKASGPRPTKKAAAAKTDKAARARTISQGKPRRPTRTA